MSCDNFLIVLCVKFIDVCLKGYSLFYQHVKGAVYNLLSIKKLVLHRLDFKKRVS